MWAVLFVRREQGGGVRRMRGECHVTQTEPLFFGEKTSPFKISPPFSVSAYTVLKIFPLGKIGITLASQTLTFAVPYTSKDPSTTPPRSLLIIALVPAV
jgi:hypothetical protein